MERADVRLHTQPFLLVVAPSPTSESRLGIIITKRIDKRAVVRNRIRRRVREIFRHYRADLKQPLDILVIARKAALSCPFSVMQRQTVAALRRHGYLSSDKTSEMTEK